MAKKVSAKATAKQHAAAVKWAAAGRASAKNKANKAKQAGQKSTRTTAQHAASVRAAAAGRAAQAARKAGKTYVSTAKPKAPAPDPGLHALPLCGPVAVAEHLAAWTGTCVPDDAVLALWHLARNASLADLLEHVAAEGFAGQRLKTFRPCDPGEQVPGLVYGMRLPYGYHAVFSDLGGTGVISWGLFVPWGDLLPWHCVPDEAWHLEWGR